MENVMKVSEVQIIPIKPHQGLVAFASLVVDGSLYLGSIGVHTRIDGNGYRITYPTKVVGERNMDIFHPISRTASADIEQAIIRKYEEVMKETYDNSNAI